MAREIAGLANFGIAFETTLGTYVAPTKFIPIRSSSIHEIEDKQWRMNIRGLADRQNPLRGYTRVEGDVVFEVHGSLLLYFLYAARTTPTKTGAMAPFTYTFTPANVTEPTTGAGAAARKTLSVYEKMAGVIFAYTGCSVTQLQFTVEDSILMCTATIIGQEEATQGSTAATYGTEQPYSAGKVELAAGDSPAPAVRTDVDTVNITINDNGTAENRIKTGGRGPQFIKWGEREVTASFEADFADKNDFTDFTGQTKWEVRLKGEETAMTDSVEIKVNAAAIETYTIGLPGLGDLVRASIDMHGYYDTGDVYTITAFSSENIT